jgi:protein SCO1/2
MAASAYDPGWMSMPWPAPGSRSRIPGILLVMALVAAATVTACAGTGATPSTTTLPAVTPAPLGQRDTAYDPPRPAPPLQLTDQDGQPFDLTSLRGAPVLVFFGYTHCADICPTTMADLRSAVRLVARPVHVVFVTIDPARDDAAAMKEYVDYYQAGFIGLTGSQAQIAAVAAAWGVSYAKLPADAAGNYDMDHSTDVYLVDSNGVLRNHIFFGAGPQLIAQLVRAVI